MTLVEPVPKPVFKRKPSVVDFPDSVKLEIDIRSKGLCEGKDCQNRKGDTRGLVYAHRFRNGHKGKGMGGSRRIPTAEDGWKACWPCHLAEDHGLREA